MLGSRTPRKEKSLWQHQISSATYRLRSTRAWSCETARIWWYLKPPLKHVIYQRYFLLFLTQILEFLLAVLMILDYHAEQGDYFSQFKCSEIATNEIPNIRTKMDRVIVSDANSTATYIKTFCLRNCEQLFHHLAAEHEKYVFYFHSQFHVIETLILSHSNISTKRITSKALHFFSYAPFTSYSDIKLRKCGHLMILQMTFQAYHFWCFQVTKFTTHYLKLLNQDGTIYYLHMSYSLTIHQTQHLTNIIGDEILFPGRAEQNTYRILHLLCKWWLVSTMSTSTTVQTMFSMPFSELVTQQLRLNAHFFDQQ